MQLVPITLIMSQVPGHRRGCSPFPGSPPLAFCTARLLPRVHPPWLRYEGRAWEHAWWGRPETWVPRPQSPRSESTSEDACCPG